MAQQKLETIAAALPQGSTRSPQKRTVASLALLLGLLASMLSGCVVVPAGGYYGYGYEHHHYYGRPYYHRYYYYEG